jgi:hypothetical protein
MQFFFDNIYFVLFCSDIFLCSCCSQRNSNLDSAPSTPIFPIFANEEQKSLEGKNQQRHGRFYQDYN